MPIVPEELLEMVQLPSVYIMGMHSSLRCDVEEMVSGDGGRGEGGREGGREGSVLYHFWWLHVHVHMYNYTYAHTTDKIH